MVTREVPGNTKTRIYIEDVMAKKTKKSKPSKTAAEKAATKQTVSRLKKKGATGHG